MRRLVLPLVLLAGLGHAPALLAQACTSFATGNWTAAGTWNAPCNVAGGPTANNSVTIQNGHTITVTLAGGAVAAGALTIAGGATATGVTLLNNLTVTNAMGGVLNTGDVIINGPTAAVTKQLAVGARTLTVTGNVSLNGGTTTASANNVAQLTAAAGTVSITGNLLINASTTVQSNTRVTLTTGLITINGDTTLTGGAAGNQDALLSVTGVSAVGNGVNIGGNLNVVSTVAASSNVTLGTGSRITVGGNVTNGDTITVAAGIFTANGATFAVGSASMASTTTVALNGQLIIAGNATITGGSTASSVASIIGTLGTINITGNATVTGGSFTPSGATLSVTTTTGSLTIGGDLSINGGTATTSNALVSVSTGSIAVTGNTTVTGRTGATGGTATLSATLAPVAPGTGINLTGTLGIVTTAAGGVASATASTAGGGVINVVGNVNNGGTVTVAAGTFSVTNAASTYTNSSAVVIANTTITTGTLSILGTLNNAAAETMSVTTTGNITVGDTITYGGTLTNSGTITLAATLAGSTVNAYGTFTNTGTFTHNGTRASQLNLGGATSTIDGTYTRGIGTVTMNGAPPLAVTQTLSGTELTELPLANGLNNFTIDNTSGFGVTLGSNVAVKGTLTFTTGNVTTGANTLTIGALGSTAGTPGTTSHVIGNMAKAFPLPVPSSFTYTIGDGTNYTPLTVTFFTLTAGNLTVSATSGEHPDTTAGTSLVRSAQSVNRYWTLKASTLAGIFSARPTYVDGIPVDRDALATYPNFSVSRGTDCSGTRTCASWAIQSLGAPAPSATQITATAMSMTSGVLEYDLVVGEPTLPRVVREKEFIFTRELY